MVFIFDKSAHSSGTASVARLAPGQPLFGPSRGFRQGMSQTAPSAKRCVLSLWGGCTVVHCMKKNNAAMASIVYDVQKRAPVARIATPSNLLGCSAALAPSIPTIQCGLSIESRRTGTTLARQIALHGTRTDHNITLPDEGTIPGSGTVCQ